MPECYTMSCSEPPTHDVEFRDARLTYAGEVGHVSRSYCAEHADKYRDDDRCIVRSLHTGRDR